MYIYNIYIVVAVQSDPFQAPPTITKVISPLISFPLQLMNCFPYHKQRAVLVGDAAHNIHPQAGQGLNIGKDTT
jgi:2-polyprenyl-6-methoxyphenol hydroxylase-like FAD-dependent oxidoreductase